MSRLTFLLAIFFVNTYAFVYDTIIDNPNVVNDQNYPWPPKIEYLDQKIDHFNYSPYKNTFRQKYLYEDKFFDGKGPIFFYCGNEGPVESFWKNTGFVFQAAYPFKALVVFGEHRYYGSSLPFNSSFEQPYIQFLSIEQALADYAFMINHIKDKWKIPNTPVIAFGGSYGGMLAAYMRVRFPHIVTGALAASAPVNWVAGIGDMHVFFEATTKDYFEADKKCVPTIRGAYSEILKNGELGKKGYDVVTEKMKLCDPIKDQNDLNWMLKWSRNAFVMMAMMDYPYETQFLVSLPANPVNASCEKAIASKDPISALSEAVSVMYPLDKTRNCYDFKSQYIECSDITGCGIGNDAYAWDFQSCTEMHLYDGKNTTSADMFPSLPLTAEQVAKYCKMRWGVTRTERQLSTFFGTDIWKSASNIIFSNGNRDPWRHGGILEKLSDSVIALTVQGGAHHLDLRKSNPKDPRSVVEVRQQEILTIKDWLKPKHYHV